MRAEELLTWVRRVPFQAFRLRLIDGRSFEIRHPRTMRVGRTNVQVFFYRGEPVDPYERADMISLEYIESVEAFGAESAA